MLNAQRPLPHRSQPLTRVHLIFCHSSRCISIPLSWFYSFCIERTIDVRPDLVALCLLKRLFIQILTDSNPLREFFQQTFVIDMHCDTLKPASSGAKHRTNLEISAVGNRLCYGEAAFGQQTRESASAQAGWLRLKNGRKVWSRGRKCKITATAPPLLSMQCCTFVIKPTANVC
jgi:hypothetical protein